MKEKNPEKSNISKIGFMFKIIERDKLKQQMQLQDVQSSAVQWFLVLSSYVVAAQEDSMKVES